MIGGDAQAYAVEKATHLTSAAVLAEYWAEFNVLLMDVDQDIEEGAARGVMFALTRAYGETPEKFKLYAFQETLLLPRGLSTRASLVSSLLIFCAPRTVPSRLPAQTRPGQVRNLMLK